MRLMHGDCLELMKEIHFIGIELDEGYFEIAQKRIEDAQRERESKLF